MEREKITGKSINIMIGFKQKHTKFNAILRLENKQKDNVESIQKLKKYPKKSNACIYNEIPNIFVGKYITL